MENTKGLKQKLENLDISKIEDERAEKNIFRGAGWVGVVVGKGMGKALGLKKDGYYGYIIWSGSSNGSIDILEDEVQKIVDDFNKKYQEYTTDRVKMYSRLN